MKIIKSLLAKLGDDLLVEITQEELRIFSFSGGEKYRDEPLIAIEKTGDKVNVKAIGSDSRNCAGPGVEIHNPFKHQRSMVASYAHAEKLLEHAFKSIYSSIFLASPRVIMHQLEKNEGGLTDIEERVLSELALRAGARKVVVYQGDRIDPTRETFDSIESRIDAA